MFRVRRGLLGSESTVRVFSRGVGKILEVGMSATYSLYGGRVKLEFDPGKHSYFVHTENNGAGAYVPSVTAITGVIGKGGGLLQWGANQATSYLRKQFEQASEEEWAELIHDDKLWDDARFAHRRMKQEAADIGSQAHKWIESLLRGTEEPLPADRQVKSACEAAMRWLSQNIPEALDCERKVFSVRYGYAGTLDKVAVIHGERCVLDWKTGNAIYPEHKIQTAAYAKAYTEETGEEISCRWLIRLGKKDGKFEPVQLTEGLEDDFKAFLAAKELWTWQQRQR